MLNLLYDVPEIRASCTTVACWRSGVGYRGTEEECDFAAPVEVCCAAAFVGPLVPLLVPVFARPVVFDMFSFFVFPSVLLFISLSPAGSKTGDYW